MRKYHRWLSILFGVFILWIATTGLASQITDILAHAERGPPPAAVAEKAASDVAALVVPAAQAHEGHDDEAQVPAAANGADAKAGFTCPEGWTCAPTRPRPQMSAMKQWQDYFVHLHSGESFGPIGTAISVLSGFALLFFAFSGLWMYLQMFRNRRARGLSGGMFWN
ncbi:MAG: PepSY-associated TM helix domain-containing protein [Croceibacterium sp.]